MCRETGLELYLMALTFPSTLPNCSLSKFCLPPFKQPSFPTFPASPAETTGNHFSPTPSFSLTYYYQYIIHQAFSSGWSSPSYRTYRTNLCPTPTKQRLSNRLRQPAIHLIVYYNQETSNNNRKAYTFLSNRPALYLGRTHQHKRNRPCRFML
jgi:hypothetical protein